MTEHRLGRRPVEELILAAADGELGPDDVRALATHLTSCSECAALATEHRRLADRLARTASAPAAQQASLARIRAAANVPVRPAFWQVAFAVLGVLLLVAGFIGVRTGVARPTVPEREIVLERAYVLDGNDGTLLIENGRAVALPGHSSGVLVRVTLKLKNVGPGSAEVRFAAPGEDYGILASASDLSGVHSLGLEGRFPRPTTSTIYTVWIHLEHPMPVDTESVGLRVDPVGDGERARAP
jgi:hypothetical protein